MNSPLLNDEVVDFIQGPVSISIGSRDEAYRPSLTRGLGCRVDAARRTVTVLLSRAQSRQVLEDVDRHGVVAVTFNLPSTHRTLQLKGADARQVPAEPDDFAVVVPMHTIGFSADVVPLGFTPAMIHTLLRVTPDDLAAIAFTPGDAFTQTPGPQAGRRVSTT